MARRFADGVLWAVAVFLLAGCEGPVSDTDGNATLTIEPSSVTVEGGASNVAFEVRGGYAPYAWFVEDTNLGSIAAAGDRAVYVSNVQTGVNTVTATDARSNAVSATVSQE